MAGSVLNTDCDFSFLFFRVVRSAVPTSGVWATKFAVAIGTTVADVGVLIAVVCANTAVGDFSFDLRIGIVAGATVTIAAPVIAALAGTAGYAVGAPEVVIAAVVGRCVAAPASAGSCVNIDCDTETLLTTSCLAAAAKLNLVELAAFVGGTELAVSVGTPLLHTAPLTSVAAAVGGEIDTLVVL